jgi:hypothetical protein
MTDYTNSFIKAINCLFEQDRKAPWNLAIRKRILESIIWTIDSCQQLHHSHKCKLVECLNNSDSLATLIFETYKESSVQHRVKTSRPCWACSKNENPSYVSEL